MVHRLFVGLAGLCMACGAKATGAAERAEAWLERSSAKGLVMDVAAAGPGDGFVAYCDVNRETVPYCRDMIGQDSQFMYSTATYEIGLGFAEPIGPTTPVDEVRARLRYISLAELPIPGLEIPGWKVRPLTRGSSFKEGVEVVDYQDKLLTLKVKTTFYALRGEKGGAACEPVPDASLPRECYFRIDGDLPLDLTLTLPLFAPARR